MRLLIDPSASASCTRVHTSRSADLGLGTRSTRQLWRAHLADGDLATVRRDARLLDGPARRGVALREPLLGRWCKQACVSARGGAPSGALGTRSVTPCLQALCVLHAQHARAPPRQQQQHAVVAGGQGGHDILACARPATAGRHVETCPLARPPSPDPPPPPKTTGALQPAAHCALPMSSAYDTLAWWRHSRSAPAWQA